MGGIPFVEPLDNVVYGRVDCLSPLVSRVIANNPSKFTYRGTGTYIIGRNRVVVIDPGPDLASHRDALDEALKNSVVVGIVVTHCHSDHVPLASWLSEKTGAPTFAFGPHPRHEVAIDDTDDDDDDSNEDGDSADETKEHIDHDFEPTVRVSDGEKFLTVDDWSLTAVHTPGHTSNHLCVYLDAENVLFTGDHIMGWSTTVVSPPDGNMSDYIASVRKLLTRGDEVLYPTHGNPIRRPREFLDAYLAHRLEREEQIVHLLRDRERTIHEMVDVLYVDVRKELHKAARRSVLAHMHKLVDDGTVVTRDGSAPTARSVYVLK
jgi:glyoxylase-like metal-dependent hydrolase (beta-lactamase superfamily II)